MKDIENFIKEHRTDFDILEPKDKSWEVIESQIIKQESVGKELQLKPNTKKVVSLLMKIAAVAILLIGASFLWNLQLGIRNSVFDNIAMDSPSGLTIPLVPSMNKLTLVQFWESGNLVCTDNNCYYYKPAYEKYKDRGFEIYSISLDIDKEKWLKNIEEQQLPWTQVSDLLGWNSPVCIACEVSEVPTSFLLNQQGVVIAKNLIASELERTLEKFL